MSELRFPGVDKRWLITFADLIALMLTFFVLLFSMSSFRDDAWSAVVIALSQSLNPARIWGDTPRLTDRTATTEPAPSAANLDYLDALIAEKLRGDPLLGRVIVERRDDRIVLMLPSDMLFAPASDRLTARALRAIGALAMGMRDFKNRIDVVGHADERPVRGDRFASNWELSLSRALAVADAMRAAGFDRPLSVRARAAAVQDDVAEDLPAAERYRLARRVDIVVREDYGGDSARRP